MKATLPLGVRISLPVVVMTLGLLAIAGTALVMQRSTMMEERRTLLQEHVASAISLLEGVQARVSRGEVSLAQAQEEARTLIRSLSFGDNNYIFVTDRHNTVIVNRGALKLEGKDVSGLKDVNGVYFIRQLNEATLKGEDPFLSYHWPHAGQEKPAPKLAFAARFQPWDWLVGTGVYMDDVDALFLRQVLTLGLAAGLILALASGVAVSVMRGVTKPLAAIKAAMVRLSEGDLNVSVTGSERGDEIGAMAQALAVFRDTARTSRRLEEDARAADHRLVEERRQARVALAEAFEAQVGEILNGLAVAAEELDQTARAMGDTARVSLERSVEVSRSLRDTNGNVQSVASAAEEMSASIGEISSQVTRSTSVVGEAVDLARVTNESVRALSEAAERIGQVVTLITDVASQTNLLALNATIEAARAGDAGKGFAVVAGEVKTLANQTSRATEEIARQINDVQARTTASVTAIEQITRSITQVNEISATIAAAIEEQGAATHEISRAIQQASLGASQVSENADGVHQAADMTGMSARDVGAAASILAHKVGDLRLRVSDFLVRLREG
ncbi:methyl-accepting chemotaxis protein [Pararhodospirillum photometricum]|uniref:Methyl-accepting chemotaxis sensory transducer n=1 Tax=Pararhodospirillum photometricum DSM 122 TaxID=1150469 RepID=H6SN59_PARPM|nr:cache domain-containing protein [Pararhodospirillum photometricum]CCG06935.1 Methyl-accepting chemotaxis sensory transducer [Pararhodospirillum photometricum DSM 122]